jgi:hypothetical protein
LVLFITDARCEGRRERVSPFTLTAVAANCTRVTSWSLRSRSRNRRTICCTFAAVGGALEDCTVAPPLTVTCPGGGAGPPETMSVARPGAAFSGILIFVRVMNGSPR